MRPLVAALLCLLAVSCGGDEPPTVDWSRYADTGFRDGIADAARAKDCTALQRWFDAADGSSDTYRAKDGEGNGDLMAFIDWQMKQADCY